MHANKILFFGDSLTAGYGLANPAREALPGLIQQKIEIEKLPYQTVNAGLSGDTSAGGVNRLGYWLQQKPAIFVLELGINDLLRGIAPSTTFKNLNEIFDQVTKSVPGIKLALMGMTLPVPELATVAPGFHDLYDRLAALWKPAYVPFYLAGVLRQPQLNLADGVHPNAAGYQIIVDNVWPVLRPLLSTISSNV